MLIVVDIGNTNITVGLISKQEIISSSRISTQLWRTEDEHFFLFKEILTRNGLQENQLTGSILSSVVPTLTTNVSRSLTKLSGHQCLIVQPGIKTGIKIDYKHPSQVGADRVVNAAATKHIYSYPAIIIDFGTATTFCLINEHGHYKGGAIFPGIRTVSDALYNAASLLPRVSFEPPEDIIGNTTVQSIQSGMFYGYLDLVEGMINRIKQAQENVNTIISTGGLGRIISEHSKVIQIHDPDLTLKGLELIYRYNTHSFDVDIW